MRNVCRRIMNGRLKLNKCSCFCRYMLQTTIGLGDITGLRSKHAPTKLARLIHPYIEIASNVASDIFGKKTEHDRTCSVIRCIFKSHQCLIDTKSRHTVIGHGATHHIGDPFPPTKIRCKRIPIKGNTNRSIFRLSQRLRFTGSR